MTHDELLAKIEKINLVSCDQTIDSPKKIIICGECFVCQALYALRAVVELHKPVTDMNGYSACEECSRIAYYNVPYPCLTNQAIEKELE